MIMTAFTHIIEILFDRGEEGEEEIRAITDYCVRTLCVCTAACNHWSSAFAIVVCLMG